MPASHLRRRLSGYAPKGHNSFILSALPMVDPRSARSVTGRHRVRPTPNRTERKIMADGKRQDSVLDASYEAVKVELENTERDLVRLKERTDKLRTAIDALSDLLPSAG